MSLNLGTMYAALALDPSNFNNTLNGLPDEAQAVFSKIQGIIGRAFSFEEVITFGKNSLKAFMEQENAVNAYSSALRNLGFEYQARTREANAFASEMQKITKYGDEMTVSAMAQGIKLGIDPSQIQQATKAAMVMAEKYGMDLPSAMMLLGRASQGQTQMLTRYGIVLDETLSAEEKFNQLLQMGADEFNLVTDAAKTTEGQFTQNMNAIGDTMETVGEKIAAFILPLYNFAGWLATAFNSISPGMQSAAIYGAALITTMKLLGSEMGQKFLDLSNAGVKSIADSIKFYDYDAAAKEAAEQRKLAAVKARIAEEEVILAEDAVKTAMRNEQNALNELNSLKSNGEPQNIFDHQELLQKEQNYAAAVQQTIAAKNAAAAAEVKAATARNASTAATRAATLAEAQNAKMTAASAGIFTRFGNCVVRGARSAGAAMKGFFASLGPVGWAILAIEGIIAVYNLITGAAEEAAEAQRSASEEAVKQSQEALHEANRELEAYENKMNRLEQLAEKEKLSNDETREAKKLIREMNELYGVQAGQIDAVTGSLKLNTEELERNLEEQFQNKKAKAEQAEKDAKADRTSLYHAVLDTYADISWGRDTTDFETARGFLGASYDGAEFDVEKINAALRDPKVPQKVKDLLIKAREAQQRVAQAREDAASAARGMDDYREAKEEEEKRKAQKLNEDNWAAYHGYESKKQKMAYDEMSNSDKLKATQKEMQDLQAKIQAVEQGGVSPEEYQQWIKLKEQELDLQKKLKDLEKQVTEEKKRQADEAEREAKAREKKQQEDQLFLDNAEARHSGVFSEAEKRRAKEETDRQFRQLLNLGRGSDSEAARFAGNRKYQVEEQIAQNQADFERAKADAMADGTLDEQEKAYINSLIEARSKLQTELENWEGKLKEAESVDEDATKEASEAVGAWSAEVLNAQLGGPRSTEKLIEKNTREQVRISRDMLSAMTTSETYTD